MRWPAKTSVVFSEGQRFVESHGDVVWTELCDVVQTGVWISVRDIADTLPCLAQYAPVTRSQYLRQVLKAIQADVAERPEAYDVLPFETQGRYLISIKL